MLKKTILAASAFLALPATYLWSIMPYGKRKKHTRALFRQKFIAHRGLFDNPAVPENSIAAFKQAIDKGYGIELDVQLTRDNKLVVFHDNTLKRMCTDTRKLNELTYSQLSELTLCGTEEKIPLFEDVLSVIDGQVPLIVEIKPEGNYIRAACQTDWVLRKYKGAFCVESFNPFVLFWFRRHHPQVLRGQLSTDFKKDGDKHPHLLQFVLSDMLMNFLSRPDFIAYNHKHSGKHSFKICKKLYKSVNVAWTIKSPKELKSAARDFEIFIFDSFRP